MGFERSIDAVGSSLYPGQTGGRKRDATGRLQQWSRENQWVQRVASFEAHMDSIRLEEEETLVRQEMAHAAERRRVLRRRASALADKAHKLLDRTLDGTGDIKPSQVGHIRDLILACERLGETEERAFRGLPDPSVLAASQGPEMPPEMAAAWEVFWSAWQATHPTDGHQ
jgi:hypothetical protein